MTMLSVSVRLSICSNATGFACTAVSNLPICAPRHFRTHSLYIPSTQAWPSLGQSRLRYISRMSSASSISSASSVSGASTAASVESIELLEDKASRENTCCSFRLAGRQPRPAPTQQRPAAVTRQQSAQAGTSQPAGQRRSGPPGANPASSTAAPRGTGLPLDPPGDG